MVATSTKSSFWRGFRTGVPFLMVIIPFGLLFGIVATDAGMSSFEALAFSVVVIAGAAQFTAVQLLQDQAPMVVVLASAIAVNLRMAMYSASMTPHLGRLPLWKRAMTAYFLVDQVYASAILEYEERPQLTLAEKFAFFMGVVTPICLPWYVATVAGTIVGNAIPPELGLDFAVPITFLAMIGPMLRTRAHVWAAIAAVAGALAFVWLPFNLGLMVGAIAGMITGAYAETRAEEAKA
ncbi:MAG: AzlC family ABC transporter permease [Pseudomonadota bacterium]|uniref:4-azaleucine resistance probable transporter AzlC n=1 Tax=Thalassococcus halodurans TaxID=373675 RepID=A0A1H5YGY9_9RHOB|nr:AzlC family ABC transporter permease [Thalassococcus halodurans]MEC7669235.1 AzlC family ABC transporter permease [Pseudomonadota bacterium]MEC8579891.1 AzlC family ABC transporter permease [Pseudomonadota bacterium]SEG22945.1 4-azaleucine resistance probable transporter AzlC [Thalassococcus halodurans]